MVVLYTYGWCGARGECYSAWKMAGTSRGEWWQV